MLPVDAGKAILVGRVDLGAGPTPVVVRNGEVEDVSAIAPTVSDLLDHDAPASVSGPILFTLDELVARAGAQSADRPVLLSPLDLQVIKAAGVTFAVSAIERVIEEAARGDIDAAAAVRSRLESRIGSGIRAVVPGSPEADALKQALIEDGMWSQYLEVAIGPDAHDRLVGVTSHLPHVLANVLLNHAGSTRIEGHDPLQAAGGSLRDMTRIAGANPRIWVDIFLDNREALSLALAEQRRALERVERALAEEDAGYLARWIGEASAHRRRLLETAFADPGALQRLRIHIPDRPGVLAGIFQALGAERINIEDFEMDHVSSERGGTLTVLVSGEGEAERALQLLESQGYGVVATPVIGE